MQKRRHLGLPHILFDALLLGAREHLFSKKAFGAKEPDRLAISSANPRALIWFAYYNADQAWPFAPIRE